MRMRSLVFRRQFAPAEHNTKWWATLGHTDELECTEMKAATLADIHRLNDAAFLNNTTNRYHHVIHLISTEEEETGQASDAEIWTGSNDFLAVTRIHFQSTTEHKKHFDELKEYLSQLSSGDDRLDISWRLYFTIELSDLVLVSKSKRFHSLSRWVLSSTKNRLIGSSYTHFCIPGSLLEDKGDGVPTILEKDYVDFLSIRFSTYGNNNNDDIRTIRRILGEKYTMSAFRIAGNEDAIICGHNIPTLNLLELYRELYSSRAFAFKDVITRIGADWNCNSQIPGGETHDVNLCGASLSLANQVKTNFLSNGVSSGLEERDWFRPLVELSNTLVHMSQSAVTDEPVYLVLPGLKAFWENAINNSTKPKNDKLYLRFSELSIHTIEHLMRAEGQLSQKMEIRPLSYDIPVFILEYATSFLLELSRELTTNDPEHLRKIRFILVPCAEVDVSAVELFQATQKSPGLVLITTPFSLLYKPRLLLPSLCHELAHYVGDTLRIREDRYDSFLHCIAKETIERFFFKVSDRQSGLIDFVAKIFSEALCKRNKCDVKTVNSLPLFDLVGQLSYAIERLTDDEVYAETIREYMKSKCPWANFYSITEETRKGRLRSLLLRISDLARSYRETYADVCTIFYLSLQPEDYLCMALREWDEINTSTLLQIYISLRTSGHSTDEIKQAVENNGRVNGVSGERRDKASEEIDKLKNLIDKNKASSEHHLFNYIKKCWKGFEDERRRTAGDKQHNCAKSIYDTILTLEDKDCTNNYRAILDIIDFGRRLTLDQLKDANQ